MSVPFYNVSVANFLQGLNAVAGILEKGKTFCEENDIPLDDMVGYRLIDDMNPFQFQVISVAHHSMGAMKGLAAGEFAPPNGYGEPDYAGLQALIQESISYVESVDEATAESYVGKSMVFKIGGNELPFTCDNFVNTFSLPNFFFHAATTYDMLRMRGAPLGKMDFLGSMRMGA